MRHSAILDRLTTRMIYQLEVKLGLARFIFPPAGGWRLTMDIDAMEKAKGQQHSPGKAERAASALSQLEDLGVTIGAHKLFGRVDVVAEHDDGRLRLVEVEGESGRQREQALYSAIGQVVLSMKLWHDQVGYGLAVPDSREWVKQMRKIPSEVTTLLRLERYLIGQNQATSIEPGAEIPDWSRG